MFNYKSYGDLARDIAANLQKLPPVDLVVGVPKSGLVPAIILASLKNTRFADLDSFLFSFSSRSGKRKFAHQAAAKTKVLIVDDSVNTGAEFRRVRSRVEHMWPEFEFTFCAIYGRNPAEQIKEADLVLASVPQPRIFQWNYRNHIIAEHALFDMDGVLCVDPTDEQNDDGEAYIDFVLNAEPLVIPIKTISAIVTSRLERFRPQTEQWLQKHEVKYKELIMLDLPSAEERRRLRAHAPFKAEVYKGREEFLFVESNWKQAQSIAKQADKAVLCTENDMMLFGESHLSSLQLNNRLPSSDAVQLEAHLQHNIQQLVGRLIETDPYAATWLAKSGLDVDYRSIQRISPFHKTRLVSTAIHAKRNECIVPDVSPSMDANVKRILMISTTFDISKGAGAAASSLRLKDSLIEAGHDVTTLGLEDFPELIDQNVDQPIKGSHIGMWVNYANGSHSRRLSEKVEAINPDCIVLGAVDRGILSMFDIAKLRYPIVWINRDNWAHTGGCLFKLPKNEIDVSPDLSAEFMSSLTCDRYKTGCEECPALKDHRESPKTKIAYELKRAVLSYRKDIVFAPISTWLASMMKKAPLCEGHSILTVRNPIDLTKVKRLEKQPASIRDELNLAPDEKIVLLAAHSFKNMRKGLKVALDALSKDDRFDNCTFVVMGTSSLDGKLVSDNLKIHPLGFIDDEDEKIAIYNQADVTLLPALQESLSVVGSDSICCGTPVVAFQTSGLTTFLKHKKTGYLAKAFDAEDLLNGLHWVLNDAEPLTQNCLSEAKTNFDPKSNVASLIAAIDQAVTNFKQLGEIPSDLIMLEKAMTLIHEDSKFRWQDARFSKKRLNDLTSLQKMPLANMVDEVFELRKKLAWNRKKRSELELVVKNKNSDLESKLAWNRKKRVELEAEVAQLKETAENKNDMTRNKKRSFFRKLGIG